MPLSGGKATRRIETKKGSGEVNERRKKENQKKKKHLSEGKQLIKVIVIVVNALLKW